MDSVLGKTIQGISHATGLGTMEASVLLGFVFLFVLYKIIDKA